MDKKTLSTPIPPRDICKWHNLPTVTVYMFALYFSPTFNLPFGGETGDRPATRWALCAWDQYRLQGVARKTCSDTQCKGCQLSSTEKHGGGGIHGRIWVFSWSFFGDFFFGGEICSVEKSWVLLRMLKKHIGYTHRNINILLILLAHEVFTYKYWYRSTSARNRYCVKSWNT